MPTLRDRVLAALETVRDTDGVIVHGEGRVLAWRPASINTDSYAVLIDLDDGYMPPLRRHPVQHLMPEVE